MRAGGQYHYSSVTCTRQNNTACVAEPHEPVHYGCTQERVTPSSCSARWTSNTCKPYWPQNYQKRVCSKQRTRSFPLDFKYSLWTSSADVNNDVGCLASGCLQRRRVGDEKQWIILEWPNTKTTICSLSVIMSGPGDWFWLPRVVPRISFGHQIWCWCARTAFVMGGRFWHPKSVRGPLSVGPIFLGDSHYDINATTLTHYKYLCALGAQSPTKLLPFLL